MHPTVTVLGAGAMGEAIIRGLLDAGWPTVSVTAADISVDRVETLAAELGITTSTTPADVVAGAEVVVLAVKPNHIVGLVADIREALTPDHLIVSIAAGIPTTTIEAGAPGIPVVRCMPNTPALLGAGAAAIAGGVDATDDSLATARRVLEAVGRVVEVPEGQIDAVTAVSGSGPAYVFLLSEAMQAAAVAEGLDPDVATTLVNQTILGAGRMLTETGTGASVLRERVTSPNGTTAAALASFDADGFRPMVARAVRAAAERSVELGREG